MEHWAKSPASLHHGDSSTAWSSVETLYWQYINHKKKWPRPDKEAYREVCLKLSKREKKEQKTPDVEKFMSCAQLSHTHWLHKNGPWVWNISLPRDKEPYILYWACCFVRGYLYLFQIQCVLLRPAEARVSYGSWPNLQPYLSSAEQKWEFFWCGARRRGLCRPNVGCCC